MSSASLNDLAPYAARRIGAIAPPQHDALFWLQPARMIGYRHADRLPALPALATIAALSAAAWAILFGAAVVGWHLAPLILTGLAQ